MNLRPATEDDLPAILAIYNHAIETTTAVFDYRRHTLDMRLEWFRAKRAAGLPVIAAVDGLDVLGFATYGPFRAWPAYKYSVEHSVYVAVSARNRGVGRALVAALIEDARRNELHTIVAGIVSDNTPSLRLHRALGFIEVGEMRQVGFKFERWLDLTFMQFLLETPACPSETEH